MAPPFPLGSYTPQQIREQFKAMQQQQQLHHQQQQLQQQPATQQQQRQFQQFQQQPENWSVSTYGPMQIPPGQNPNMLQCPVAHNIPQMSQVPSVFGHPNGAGVQQNQLCLAKWQRFRAIHDMPFSYNNTRDNTCSIVGNQMLNPHFGHNAGGAKIQSD
ncbi:hypothetical protein Cantr_05826 [Candida viswanathii]|uniref:Uncharacterized protein n=1 Tax=Candida viswanathii TaxID=5486 RepID=A0A367XQX4_9ASCO|nr:hypothetical protein Cantr_05826 [Candida viswanathii]